MLRANCCESLESLGDLSNYKWLWNVSCYRWKKWKKWVGGERVLHSMLQGNAVENHFISFHRRPTSSPMPHQQTPTLQLPHNWYNDFSGFLLCTDTWLTGPRLIVIKEEETRLDVQRDYWPEFDSDHESNLYSTIGYVSFGSLRHTSWWNSAHNKLSFDLGNKYNLKVVLVPRKCKGDSYEREKCAIDSSKFWDKHADVKKFEIVHDSKSSLMIRWNRLFPPKSFTV
ncbi:hypothetical protein Tco_1020985 [Tanacetum coccineum]